MLAGAIQLRRLYDKRLRLYYDEVRRGSMVRVSEFIVEGDRPDHVARHGVTIDEVEEVVFEPRNFTIKVPRGRYRMIARHEKDAFLRSFLLGGRRVYMR